MTMKLAFTQNLGEFLTDPADKNVVFALLRRLRSELAQGDGPGPEQQALEGRGRGVQSHEDLLDLDEHDGDLLEVREIKSRALLCCCTASCDVEKYSFLLHSLKGGLQAVSCTDRHNNYIRRAAARSSSPRSKQQQQSVAGASRRPVGRQAPNQQRRRRRRRRRRPPSPPSPGPRIPPRSRLWCGSVRSAARCVGCARSGPVKRHV
jgi:hypothetical protein